MSERGKQMRQMTVKININGTLICSCVFFFFLPFCNSLALAVTKYSSQICYFNTQMYSHTMIHKIQYSPCSKSLLIVEMRLQLPLAPSSFLDHLINPLCSNVLAKNLIYPYPYPCFNVSMIQSPAAIILVE